MIRPILAVHAQDSRSTLVSQQMPYDAWISSRDDVWVRSHFGNYGPSVGLLRYGNVVHVTACENNDCTSERNPWVQLEPFGVIRLSTLSPINTITREAQFWQGTADNFIWAKVIRNVTTTTGEHFRHNDEIVFRNNPELLASSGLYERPDGGTIRATNVSIFVPSTFSGWIDPPDHFAFVLRDSTFLPRNQQALRYDKVNVISEDNISITSLAGSLPRRDVRVGIKHSRPSGVPAGSRWVHVDLDQQILTAYDYNDDLVFATLVSTGRGSNRTATGIFQVRRKTLHTHMSGGGAGRGHYSVDAVPWTMFFNEAIALHGAFWHSQFGTVRSHGCVNLSIADAKFIYEFAPMRIPNGWRAIHPIVLGIPNLWVVIE